jgi:hypothetical protein
MDHGTFRRQHKRIEAEEDSSKDGRRSVRRIGMKPLSEQLKDLSERAKKAEDDAAAARSEARADIQARSQK